MLRRVNSRLGFTLIELLVVILVIGILIAVAAPSFLGVTSKAKDSALTQENATAYQAGKAFAVGPSGNSFAGFDNSQLYQSEPELSGKTTVTVSNAGQTATFVSSDSQRQCTLVAQVDTGLSPQTCAPVSSGGGSGPPSGISLAIWDASASEIGSAKFDGSGFQLLPATSGGQEPTISPDGSKIVYVNGSTLYTINSDGTGTATLLANQPASGQYPNFSHDGTKLTFVGPTSSDGTDVYVADISAGGVLSNVTDLTNTPGFTDTDPSFTADDSKILYDQNSGVGGNDEIREIDVSGSNDHALTDGSGGNEAVPVMSPDGSTIAYAASDPDDCPGSAAIFEMNADGSNQHQAVSCGSSFYELTTPAFSSTGRLLFIGVTNSFAFNVYQANQDGFNVQSLLSQGDFLLSPSSR